MIRKILSLTAVGLAILGLGYCIGLRAPRAGGPPAPEAGKTPGLDEKGKILYYRNPMGLPDTSPAPKKDGMGMDYIPVYDFEAKDAGDRVLISPERLQKLGVRTERAEPRRLARSVRALGTIQIDEKRQVVIAPRFDGWIEKLSVNAIGMRVKKGDPLLVFYSPDLVRIEAEYPFSADQILAGGMDAAMPAASRHQANGTMEKLASLAVSQNEIDRLRREKTANYHVTLFAPANGTVIEKRAIEGMKFSPGDVLYRLVDLSHVWVIADIYEQDLARIALGQTAIITAAAFPGRAFEGKISFIYPDLNKDTRTARLRIDLPNPTGDWRTDMYVTVDLATAAHRRVLAVPASAILNSGERQVVLVDIGDGRFEPHAVTTGASGGGYVEIQDGIRDGDRIVTAANFLIDSESNMRAALQGFTKPEATR